MAERIQQIDGLASINAWDQSQAEALDSVRTSRAFVLVTLADEGGLTIHALSRDLAPEGMEVLLRIAAETSGEMADELACENEDE